MLFIRVEKFIKFELKMEGKDKDCCLLELTPTEIIVVVIAIVFITLLIGILCRHICR